MIGVRTFAFLTFFNFLIFVLFYVPCVRFHDNNNNNNNNNLWESRTTIGLNHEIAILAKVVMKTRLYLQTNCNGVLQCNDV